MSANRFILAEVGTTPEKLYRPSLWKAIGIFAAIGVLELIHATTHSDVLTVIAFGLICGGYVVWYFVRYWRSMGWI